MSPAIGKNFFIIMASILLLFVFLGFAPTLYLRPFFGRIDQPTGSSHLPVHLLLHGLALSSWYLLFALQAILVRTQRVSVHRQLGWAGAVSACAVVVSGFVVLSKVVTRRLVEGQSVPPELIEGLSGIILSQTWNLSCFVVCVALAIRFRRKAWLHKRLMLIASIQVVGAALTTNRAFGAALQSLLPDSVHVSQIILILLATALPVFDYVSERKVHAVSLIGTAILLAPMLLVPFLMGTTPGAAWVQWLGNVPG